MSLLWPAGLADSDDDDSLPGQRARPGAGRPYWASWMETAVPKGHRRVSVSPSQAALWMVLNVPERRAENEMRSETYSFDNMLLPT